MKHIDEILNRTAGATSKENTPTISNTESDPPATVELEEGQKVKCPLCKGLGFLRQDLPVEDPNFGKLLPCACQLDSIETQRMEELRRLSNLEILARYTFDSFVPQGHGLNPEKQRNLQTAFRLAQEFAADPQGWLILMGSYGSGKTHLAAAIANERVARNQLALFVNVPDLLDHLRATFRPTSEVTYDQRFEMIRTAPLLILDDLGTENATSWANEKLYQILNYRYNAQLPTVLTTNHRLEDIDARLRSRMNDQDLCRIYTILAPDYRGSGRVRDQSELSTLDLHRDQTFANFYDRTDLSAEERGNLQRALALAQNYAQDPQDWLLFTGPYGCGKTHLAAAIANHRFNQGYVALLITVPDLLDHLRATYSPASTVSYDSRFEELRTSPLLILDDLGTQSATPWAKEKLYQLFNYRYNARLPTVITSSLELSELEQQDPRLFSRLIDTTRCTRFGIITPHFRGSSPPKTSRQRKR